MLAVFIEEPSSVVVAENEVAVFRCRISNGLQGWAMDGVFVSTLQNNPDFAARSESASDGGPPVSILSIVGRSVYNGTTVQCFAFSFSGNSNSSIATLQIQGAQYMSWNKYIAECTLKYTHVALTQHDQ